MESLCMLLSGFGCGNLSHLTVLMVMGLKLPSDFPSQVAIWTRVLPVQCRWPNAGRHRDKAEVSQSSFLSFSRVGPCRKGLFSKVPPKWDWIPASPFSSYSKSNLVVIRLLFSAAFKWPVHSHLTHFISSLSHPTELMEHKIFPCHTIRCPLRRRARYFLSPDAPSQFQPESRMISIWWAFVSRLQSLVLWNWNSFACKGDLGFDSWLIEPSEAVTAKKVNLSTLFHTVAAFVKIRKRKAIDEKEKKISSRNSGSVRLLPQLKSV